MLRNLRAEMTRANVTTAMIAATTQKTVKTVRDKINESSQFGISEAIMIRDAHFPGISIEYLFASDK